MAFARKVPTKKMNLVCYEDLFWCTFEYFLSLSKLCTRIDIVFYLYLQQSCIKQGNKEQIRAKRNLGGNYIIPVSRGEILSRFTGIWAVLKTLHKFHPAITPKTFYHGKTGSLFFTVGIPLCRDEVSLCNRFSPPRRGKKVD